jgi:hypothetical protein
MLLFLLCTCVRTDGVSGASPALLRDPSMVLLEPWVVGDSRGMKVAAVTTVCSPLAAVASMRGAARTSAPVLWPDDLGIGASRGLLWFATWVDEGVVRSMSVVVEADRLLEEEGSAGAEKVLETAEWTDSCESWGTGLSTVAMIAVGVVSECSAGAMAA